MFTILQKNEATHNRKHINSKDQIHSTTFEKNLNPELHQLENKVDQHLNGRTKE